MQSTLWWTWTCPGHSEPEQSLQTPVLCESYHWQFVTLLCQASQSCCHPSNNHEPQHWDTPSSSSLVSEDTSDQECFQDLEQCWQSAWCWSCWWIWCWLQLCNLQDRVVHLLLHSPRLGSELSQHWIPELQISTDEQLGEPPKNPLSMVDLQNVKLQSCSCC